MKVYRYSELATYNTEYAKGIVHTKEYDEKMRVQKRDFDREQKEIYGEEFE